jgi:hypothetical protein
MKKLSDLVAYKNLLKTINVSSTRALTNLDLENITYVVNTDQIESEQFVNNLINSKIDLNNAFDQIDKTLNQLIQQVNDLIAEYERPLFQQSYTHYEQRQESYQSYSNWKAPAPGPGYWSDNAAKVEKFLKENHEYTLNTRLNIDDETLKIFQSRITNQAVWKYPGMIIRPGVESFVTHMVATDPLYLVDSQYPLLEPALTKFNNLYQQRLRTILVDENSKDNKLIKIPNNQIGVCLAYNYFNYLPFEIIKEYLKEIYQKLRPGGILYMTFNDCDLAHAVILAEQFYACYTPGSMIRSWAEHVGFEEIFYFNNNTPSSWIEFRKPGELTSLRGGQCLAKILSKPVAKSK